MALPGSALSIDVHEPLSQTVRQGNRAYPTSPVYGSYAIRNGGGTRKPRVTPVPDARAHVPVRPGNPECPVSDTYADGVPEDISSEGQR